MISRKLVPKSLLVPLPCGKSVEVKKISPRTNKHLKHGLFITSCFRSLPVHRVLLCPTIDFLLGSGTGMEFDSSFLEVVNCPACDSSFPCHMNHRDSLFQLSQGMSFFFHCKLTPFHGGTQKQSYLMWCCGRVEQLCGVRQNGCVCD